MDTLRAQEERSKMSRRSFQQTGTDMAAIDMKHSRSSESRSSYYSEMSSVAGYSPGSSYTDVSSPEDTTLTNLNPYTNFTYSSFPANASTNDHLAFSDPNGMLVPGQWLTPPPFPPTGQSFAQGSFSMNDPYTGPREKTRHTPTSLGWLPDCLLLKHYTFVVNKDPYFELLPNIEVTAQTPQRVYLSSHNNSQHKSFPCEHPLRNEKCINKRGQNFGRSADLERHYLHIHMPKDQLETYVCDYAGCTRKANDPLTRKDHYRDHLRDYHKEDLGCAKRRKNETNYAEKQRIWQQERRINSKTWRCAKCLRNNKVADSWSCVRCKSACEEDRKMVRIRQAADEAARAYICNTCNGMAWIETSLNSHGGWGEPCPECQVPSAGEYSQFDTEMYDYTG